MLPLKRVEIDVEVPENGALRRVKIDVAIKNIAVSRSFKVRMQDKHSAILTKPKYASLKDALAFLDTCKDWFAEQTLSMSSKVDLSEYLQQKGKVFVSNKHVDIEIITSRTTLFAIEDVDNSKIVFAVRESNFDVDLQNLFLKFATRELENIAKVEAVRTDLKFAKISVRDQSSRWASQSSSGTLSLNWRVVLLEPELRRYIICHELAHTVFMDHSVSFWIYLNRIFPDAQKADRKVSKLAKDIFNIQLKNKL